MRERGFKETIQNHKIIIWIFSVLFAFLAGACSYSQILYGIDHTVSDYIFQSAHSTPEQAKIIVIMVDEDTVEQYGKPETWSRMRLAELVRHLNGSEANAPKLIGLTMTLVSGEPAGDQALTEACKGHDNICVGDFVNKDVYDSLAPHVKTGSIHTMEYAKDGYIRTSKIKDYINGQEVDTFAYALYKMYQDAMGERVILPNVDEKGKFVFSYGHRSGEYESYSFEDVVRGKVDQEVFRDSIVLVGDTTNQRDMYYVPNQRDAKMSEVELQANILEALIAQNTGRELPVRLLAFLTFLFILFFSLMTLNSVDWHFILRTIGLFLLVPASDALCSYLGYYIPVLVSVIFMFIATVINLIMRYVLMFKKKKEMENVFKKYVDENIVNSLVDGDGYEAKIGGIRKEIAVLFVDIRGFTTLSEHMKPEEIVEILNLYLSHVADAISRNHGTLDKFIGDAAMALFNAPNDLEDYENWALCAAWDIQVYAAELYQIFQKKYGVEIYLGVGVHCGEAIIGNIGCDTRMDFTAIGDTVNTASRLEGAAKQGQILVSEELRARIPDAAEYFYTGEYSLKGKKKKISAYSIVSQPSRPVIMEIRTPSRQLSLEKRKEEILQKTGEIRSQSLDGIKDREKEHQKRREELRRKLEANRREVMGDD